MTKPKKMSREDSDMLHSLLKQSAELKAQLTDISRRQQAIRRQLEAYSRNGTTDATDSVQSSETLRLAELIIENSPAVLFRRMAAEDSEHRRMVYVSPNIARFGYTAEDFLSGRIMYREIVYPEDSQRMIREIESYVSRNIEAYTQFYRIVTRDGDLRWVEDRTSVVDDPNTGNRYHQGIVIDIHRRKEAEDKLRKSEEKYRRIVETAGKGFLLMDEHIRIIDLNEAFSRMVGYPRNELIGRSPFDLTTEAYRYVSASLQTNLRNDRPYESEIELLSRDGRKVPAIIHANALLDDTDGFIGTMAFITDMTEQKKALILAGAVQKSLLPQQTLQVKGLEICGRNVSCDEIGGDYFDFLWNPESPDKPFSVVVGDITGHGVDSALLMTTARAFLRMRASQPGTPTDIVSAMNHHLTEDIHDTGRFMTLFYLTIDTKSRHIEWVRAGHEPAWIYDPDQDKYAELKGPGMALGVNDHVKFKSNHRTGLKKGQLVIVGTDGIWEARNQAGEMFGKHRLHDVIRQNAAAGAEAILKAVFKSHAQFTQGRRNEDDITLVVIKVIS